MEPCQLYDDSGSHRPDVDPDLAIAGCTALLKPHYQAAFYVAPILVSLGLA
jgi:hypothetical protein